MTTVHPLTVTCDVTVTCTALTCDVTVTCTAPTCDVTVTCTALTQACDVSKLLTSKRHSFLLSTIMGPNRLHYLANLHSTLRFRNMFEVYDKINPLILCCLNVCEDSAYK